MSKLTLAALAAATLTLAAQAATLSWTGTSGSQTVSSGASFAIAARITMNPDAFVAGGVANNSEIIGLTSSRNVANGLGLLAYNAAADGSTTGGGANGLGAHFDTSDGGGSGWTRNLDGTTSGTHDIVLNFAWDNGNSRWGVTLHIDGNPVGFQTDTVFLVPTNAGNTTLTLNTNNAWAFEAASLYVNGTLTQQDIDWLHDNETTVVPEPTALALLALGVAGLALRRRAA